MDTHSSDKMQNSGSVPCRKGDPVFQALKQERKPKNQKSKYQLLLISNLKKELVKARALSPENLAVEIRKIGFTCQLCGKCCKRAYGDNRVIVLSEEIEIIREYTGVSRPEIAGPLLPDCPPYSFERGGEKAGKGREKDGEGKETFSELMDEVDVDSEGNIHTFGWMLRRKSNGDCAFIEEGTNRCQIYPVRSRLCSTYPFYMEDSKLRTCECEGLGYPVSEGDSRKMAEAVFNRYLAELEDMLAMYEKFEDFEKGGKGPEIAKKNAKASIFSFIVHDSDGAFRTTG